MTDIQSCIRVAGDTSSLSGYVPAGLLRRLDPVTREALLALFLVMDKGDADVNGNNDRLGLIVVTESGPVELSRRFLVDIIESGDEFASPTHFSSSVHNALAGQVSLLKKITGPVRTLSAGAGSLTIALSAAEAWLSEKSADRVLILCCDEKSSLYDLMEPEIIDRPAGAVAWLTGTGTDKPLCRFSVVKEAGHAEVQAGQTAFGLFLSVQEKLEEGIVRQEIVSGGNGLKLTLFPPG